MSRGTIHLLFAGLLPLLLLIGGWGGGPQHAAAGISPLSRLPRPCTLADLQATSSFQGATGTILGSLVLTNRSGSMCWVSGRPHIHLVGHGGRALSLDYRFAPVYFNGGWVRIVQIPAGRAVNAPVQWFNWCGGLVRFVRLVVRLPRQRGQLQAPFGGGTACMDRHKPSIVAFGAFTPGVLPPTADNPWLSLVLYYSQINTRHYHLAYRGIEPVGRPPYRAFVASYRTTTSIQLDRLVVPPYRIQQAGHRYTCVGIQLTAQQRDGTQLRSGGWYLMEIERFAARIVLPGSRIARKGPLIVPTRAACARSIPLS
jgi:hypothetical protein